MISEIAKELNKLETAMPIIRQKLTNPWVAVLSVDMENDTITYENGECFNLTTYERIA